MGYDARRHLGKNDSEVDSKSFIHCIEPASDYEPREMYFDATSRVHTHHKHADPIKLRPKLTHLPDGRKPFFSSQFASPVFSAFQSHPDAAFA